MREAWWRQRTIFLPSLCLEDPIIITVLFCQTCKPITYDKYWPQTKNIFLETTWIVMPTTLTLLPAFVILHLVFSLIFIAEWLFCCYWKSSSDFLFRSDIRSGLKQDISNVKMSSDMPSVHFPCNLILIAQCNCWNILPLLEEVVGNSWWKIKWHGFNLLRFSIKVSL